MLYSVVLVSAVYLIFIGVYLLYYVVLDCSFLQLGPNMGRTMCFMFLPHAFPLPGPFPLPPPTLSLHGAPTVCLALCWGHGCDNLLVLKRPQMIWVLIRGLEGSNKKGHKK